MLNLALALFGRGFKSSKCKTMAKLVTARIKLLRNKREVVVRQMRRDIALLLQSGQDATARIRVEHVMREQNIMAANEIIELFCELIVARLSIIAKQRDCPADLKEGISSLIFAAPRCSDIPELLQIRSIFEKKYGKEFVNSATELRPDCGVNRTLIEKLSVRTPTGDMKLKLMKEIAKEYQIAWDHTETEKELLKAPEELIEGPRGFVSAASMPVNPMSSQCGTTTTTNREHNTNFADTASAAKVAAESAEKAVAAAQAAAYLAHRDNQASERNFNYGTNCHSNSLPGNRYVLENISSPKAKNTPMNSQNMMYRHESPDRSYESHSYERSRSTSTVSNDPPVKYQNKVDRSDLPDRSYESHSYERSRSTSTMSNDPPAKYQNKVDRSDIPEESHDFHSHERSHNTSNSNSKDLLGDFQNKVNHPDPHSRAYDSHSSDRSGLGGNGENKMFHRRHSYNAPAIRSDIKFDESDECDSECDEEIEMEKAPTSGHPPPDRAPPPVPPFQSYQPDGRSSSYRRNSLPRVHPKLPDYEDLSARFEALKTNIK